MKALNISPKKLEKNPKPELKNEQTEDSNKEPDDISNHGCSANLADFLNVEFMDVEMKLHDLIEKRSNKRNGLGKKKKERVRPILKGIDANQNGRKGKVKFGFRKIHNIKNWKEFNRENCFDEEAEEEKGFCDDFCCKIF